MHCAPVPRLLPSWRKKKQRCAGDPRARTERDMRAMITIINKEQRWASSRAVTRLLSAPGDGTFSPVQGFRSILAPPGPHGVTGGDLAHPAAQHEGVEKLAVTPKPSCSSAH